MATPAKRLSPARAKRAAETSSSPASPSSSPTPPAKPYLRFYHSEELRQSTLLALSRVEQAESATAHGAALADVVVELTNAGLDYYFIQPLKLAKASFVVQKAAGLGLAGSQQVMGSVIRRIIGNMDREQLLSVCASIRRLML